MEIREDNVIITDDKKLNDIKNKISKDGVSGFYVISDFDRTLTELIVNGEKLYSKMSILRSGNYLGPEYSKEANNLSHNQKPTLPQTWNQRLSLRGIVREILPIPAMMRPGAGY